MYLTKLNITPNMSDEQLRQVAHDEGFNGEYVSKICRKCGMYWANEDGDWRFAKIVDSCKECNSEENN